MKLIVKMFSFSGLTVSALVPGNIYLDLYRNGIIDEPYYRNHDTDYRWVAYESWIYESFFNREYFHSTDVYFFNDVFI